MEHLQCSTATRCPYGTRPVYFGYEEENLGKEATGCTRSAEDFENALLVKGSREGKD